MPKRVIHRDGWSGELVEATMEVGGMCYVQVRVGDLPDEYHPPGLYWKIREMCVGGVGPLLADDWNQSMNRSIEVEVPISGVDAILP